MRKAALPLRQLPAIAQWFQTCQASIQAQAYTATERQLSSQAASTSGHSSLANWSLAAIPILGVAASLTLSGDPLEQEEFHLLPLELRQRIFFKYEKRIRDQSSLDKVFEYFSSQEKDQQEFLTPVDMLCAVVPTYPPSESNLDRSGSLAGERRSGKAPVAWSKAQTHFFQQFDVDGDGLISYDEFLLLLTLLSIPGKDVQTVFKVVDLDSSGYIDAREFDVVVGLLKNMANVRTAALGRSKKMQIDTERNKGLYRKFFGEDGTKRLSLPDLSTFLNQLHKELVKLEFLHYDCNGVGSIPALDFGRSLVATADIQHVDRLLDQVDAMPADLRAERITLDDFLAVNELRRNVHTLVVALDFCRQVGRTITKEHFVQLLSKLVDVSLSGRVVDIIFAVFHDGQGGLDVAGFLAALQRREVMWARHRNADADSAAASLLAGLHETVSSWLRGVQGQLRTASPQ